MRWAYTIGRVAGTEIKVHLTFILLVVWWALGAYQQGGPAAAITAVLFLLALFACILLHEFGHITMARRFGVNTPDVILLPIGGVARLQRLPDEPKQEFLIALAGPAVTLAIAILIGLTVALSGGNPLTALERFDTTSLIERLMVVNVYLLLFNLIPAFPMDGGRVLRAVLAQRLGLPRATQIAARVGRLLAIGMGIIGITGWHGAPPNYFLVLIAFFVFLGANAEEAAVQTRVGGRGLSVANMMVTDFRTLPVYATLGQAAELLLATEQREFPVVDNLGRVEGMLTRDGLIRGLTQHGNGATVAQAMTPRPPVVPPSLDFEHALLTLRESGLPALPVVDPGGKLVGLLTADNITDLLLVRRARGEA
jgi:stage IV sporulation protein FB